MTTLRRLLGRSIPLGSECSDRSGRYKRLSLVRFERRDGKNVAVCINLDSGREVRRLADLLQAFTPTGDQ